PTKLMNSRRLIGPPSGQRIVPVQNYTGNGATNVCFGSKADMTPFKFNCPLCAKSGHLCTAHNISHGKAVNARPSNCPVVSANDGQRVGVGGHELRSGPKH